MAARKLKVVSESDVPPNEAPSPTETVKSAAGTSYRDLLVALRDSIAGQIDAGVPPRDLASLSRRLLEIAAELEALDARAAEEGGSKGDAQDGEFDPDAI